MEYTDVTILFGEHQIENVSLVEIVDGPTIDGQVCRLVRIHLARKKDVETFSSLNLRSLTITKGNEFICKDESTFIVGKCMGTMSRIDLITVGWHGV